MCKWTLSLVAGNKSEKLPVPPEKSSLIIDQFSTVNNSQISKVFEFFAGKKNVKWIKDPY